MENFEKVSDSLREVVRLKYGPPESWGWGVRLRARFKYCTPDDRYEQLLFEVVNDSTLWLDVGCGRATLPQNPALAMLLSKRCRLLVGLDPSDNIDCNPFVHERVKSSIEGFHPDMQFDVITLRMVAEHIADPETAVSALARLLRPGGLVVVYTVWKWSPASIAAAITPIWIHHWAKRLLWNTEERDTFPVEYKMNTRRALRRVFFASGFCEGSFEYLDDCRSFQAWKLINTMEFHARAAIRLLGMGYPEACILATYNKIG